MPRGFAFALLAAEVWKIETNSPNILRRRSDALHMVERFRSSPDGGTLWLVQTYEDAAVFDGVAARYMAWTRRRGEYVYPYDCDPSYGE